MEKIILVLDDPRQWQRRKDSVEEQVQRQLLIGDYSYKHARKLVDESCLLIAEPWPVDFHCEGLDLNEIKNRRMSIVLYAKKRVPVLVVSAAGEVTLENKIGIKKGVDYHAYVQKPANLRVLLYGVAELLRNGS